MTVIDAYQEIGTKQEATVETDNFVPQSPLTLVEGDHVKLEFSLSSEDTEMVPTVYVITSTYYEGDSSLNYAEIIGKHGYLDMYSEISIQGGDFAIDDDSNIAEFWFDIKNDGESDYNFLMNLQSITVIHEDDSETVYSVENAE